MVKKVERKTKDGQCSCTALRRATRRISQLYDAALAPCGLKTTQRAILAQIRRSEPTNVGMLADALVMDSGALAHTLRPIERDGFIAIEVNPDDRRHRLITLTPQGHAKLAESELLWRKAQAGFNAAFGRVESEALRNMLELLLSDDFATSFAKGAAKPASR
ncbi:MarR family winged helix-turn-helix transcriptional regulator [Paraburkholderia sp. BCC1886]|uniref:MarR family winged helix-turn-helix transcriptional regulator n=1 Tax=Paraburkholderia sp. BCC1886 TaxID=2562670 RepID=UPI00164285AD|nr:MarR family winged helix-turn-helix transcriptional regulator [Paraburkholderia sp. BCC1886]